MLLNSRQHACIIEFTLQSPRYEKAGVPVSRTDPISRWFQGFRSDDKPGQGLLLDLHFHPVTQTHGDDSVGRNVLQSGEEQGIEYYQLFLLRKDLSLTSQLCYTIKPDKSLLRGRDVLEHVRVPEWKAIRKSWITQVGGKHYNGFVVDDGEDSGIDDPETPSLRKHHSLAEGAWISSPEDYKKPTSSNHVLYLQAVSNDSLQESDLRSVLEDIVDRLKAEASEDMLILRTV